MAIRAIGKYLRVRGEEPRRYPIEFAPREIPPRARRRDVSSLSALYTPGNTSACAEKSDLRGRVIGRPGKYLRVRGEEWELLPR